MILCTHLLQADWERALKQSTTVYVGNLSFYTREEQIYEVFSKVRDFLFSPSHAMHSPLNIPYYVNDTLNHALDGLEMIYVLIASLLAFHA